MLRLALLPAALLLCIPSALAQPALTDSPVSAIRTFFDAFAARDSTGMQAVTDPGAHLVITGFSADGSPVMRSLPMADLIRSIATREGPATVETWWNPQVERHDNLATVWVDYNLWVGDRIDHCGRDSFQLFRSPDGWRIIAVADTQRREGCIAVMRPAPADDALDLPGLYGEGITFDAFLGGVTARRERWRANFASSSVPTDLVQRLQAVKGAYRILAVAPDNCSDSADTLPHVARLAEASPNLDLRIVDPERGRAVLDAYRSPDGRVATPVYVVLDEEGRKVGVWIERPAALQDWAIPARAALDEPEFVRRKSAWYDWDHGRGTMEAVVSLLENAGRF